MLKRWGLASIAAICLSLGISSELQAAEEIVISLVPLEITVSVESLAEFVETGEVSRDLRAIANRITPEEQLQLRQLLQRRFDFTATAIDRFAATEVGDRLLTNLSSVLITRSPEAALSGVRSAFVLAASEDGLTLMSVIRRYPLQTLVIDLRRTLNAVNSASRIFTRADAVLSSLREQAYYLDADSDPELEFSQALEAEGDSVWRQEQFVFAYDVEGSGRRQIMSDLYLPEGTNLPLVVIVHGIASNRRTFDYLASHLASHGYAVAALEDPETNTQRYRELMAGFAALTNATDFIQRSQDIPQLLDALAASQPSIDTSRVGVLGQSLGGATALHSAGAQWQRSRLDDVCEEQVLLTSFNLAELLQCRAQSITDFPDFSDPRIQAVIGLNSIGSAFFGPTGLATLEVPTLIVAGTDDFFAPPLPEQIEPYSWLASEDRYLAIVDHGTHFTFLNENGDSAFPVPPELIGAAPERSRPALQGLTTAFLGRYLLNRPELDPYLSTTYLETLKREPFSFHLLRGQFRDDSE